MLWFLSMELRGESEQPENPDWLRSRVVRDAFGVSSSRESEALSNDLAALLVARFARNCVLASAVFPEPVAPFSPARRLIHRLWVGLKGAALSTNPDEASTADRRSRSAASRGSRECGGFLVLHSRHSSSRPANQITDSRHPKPDDTSSSRT